MKKKILTLASALTFVSLYSFNAYADMDLETSNAVSGIAVALNNYKASSISPQTALGESLKTATTNTIEITGSDDARTKLVKDVVKYEGPSIQDKLKEEVIKDDLAVAKNKKDTVVHSDPKETGEEVGSISYSSVATVVGSEVNETGEWLKINSGNVEGYVKASDVATGNKAKKLAKESVVTYGTVVDIDNVRLRKTPDITSGTLTMLEGGEKYVVVGQDKNFLKVQVDDDLTGYVYKDFLKTDVAYKTAKTKEESTIEALNKAKLETEAKEAMAIYENMVVADEQTAAQSKETTTKSESTTSKEVKKSSDKASISATSEEAKTVKSPAAEKRETPASKEVDIKVPDNTKESAKAEKETAKKDIGSVETAKQNVETVLTPPEAKTESETINAIEDTKPTETKITVETVKEPKASTSVEIATEQTKANIETVKEPKASTSVETATEQTKAKIETVSAPEAVETTKQPETAESKAEPETREVTETVKETPTATTASESISAIEDTTKQPETTVEATKPAATKAETKAETTVAVYGPGGSAQKPQDTEKTKKSKEEGTVVTGEKGGPGVSKKKETTAAQTEATKAVKEKASRDAVVAYAKQFVGNPYVYGGTSLTKGADCSGFVMRVYEKFGISTSRISRDQANDGTEIPISQIKPGDLVFYSSGGDINHVAIYIGDGQIIHAANKQLGIRIGSMNHRTPIKAVRLIK
ncbi:MAG: hydrolase [Lachnospiraceae bacterium]|nr:MAG: hydrolase [Lachnospiraceae bacterium]